MSTFHELETSQVIDLLVKQTTAYTKLMKDGTKEEFELCKLWMNMLQKELSFRDEAPTNTFVTGVNIRVEDKAASSTQI